jgi:uncharacterized protein
MKILVDADACPVKGIIVDVARKRGIDVIMFCDTSHMISDGYSQVVVVDKGRDSVDIKLVNRAESGDIVVTQDYGLAAMSLAKGAFPMSQNGLVYDSSNIDMLLMQRHVSQKARNAGQRTKGPKKRNGENDESFRLALERLIGQGRGAV